jgi:hypothetical protein
VVDDLLNLSPRAREIMRRADEQAASLRRARAIAEGQADGTLEPGEVTEADGPQALMDRVQAGLEASVAHLEALHEAVEAIAQELGAPGPLLESPFAPAPEEPEEPAEHEIPALLASHAITPEAALAVAHPQVVAVPDAPAPDGAAYPAAAQDAGRLVAIEMAVAGDTRENVGRRLQEEFGITDPEQILDDVFGPGTPAESRMPWGGR